MEAYKFETTILENGIIKIPDFQEFESKEVEVFIVFKPQKKIKEDKKQTIEEFIKEWTGFAKGVENTDKAKYEYLMEKYK